MPVTEGQEERQSSGLGGRSLTQALAQLIPGREAWVDLPMPAQGPISSLYKSSQGRLSSKVPTSSKILEFY